MNGQSQGRGLLNKLLLSLVEGLTSLPVIHRLHEGDQCVQKAES